MAVMVGHKVPRLCLFKVGTFKILALQFTIKGNNEVVNGRLLKLLVAVGCGLSTSGAHAVITLNFQSNFGMPKLQLSDGSDMPNDIEVEAGYFFNDDSAPTDLNDALTNWKRFGDDAPPPDGRQNPALTVSAPEIGNFFGAADSNDPQFDGRRIYIFVHPFPNAGKSEFTIFSDPSWIFINHDTPPPDNTQSIFTTSINVADEVFFGSFNGGNIQMMAVPEPTTYAAIFGLGLIVWSAGLRRRASRTQITD